MPRKHHDNVDHGDELAVADRPADQRGSWSVPAAGWDLVQLDWSQRLRERRRGSIPLGRSPNGSPVPGREATMSGEAAITPEGSWHTENRFAARIPAMYTRVCRFVRVMLVRGGDDVHARAAPRDP
jgi:hypothetical protein